MSEEANKTGKKRIIYPQIVLRALEGIGACYACVVHGILGYWVVRGLHQLGIRRWSILHDEAMGGYLIPIPRYH